MDVLLLSPRQGIPPHMRPPEPTSPVSNAEKARLICAYMHETGIWCETTDSERHFTVKSIHEMMGSAAFVAAAMALASRQLDHLERQQRPVTLELHQYSIRLLLRQHPAKSDASMLAACTLLCVYEMMASEVHEWRRHLKGCAGHLQAKRWNGSSEGIVKSCFWAFARIDVWAAFISGNSTLIPTDFWIDNMSFESVAAKGNVDDYCNMANVIFAKIVNLLAAGYHEKRYYTALATVSNLWSELQAWCRLRPKDVCPLLRDHSPGQVSPTVLYSRSSSICGNTFYHAGCILLLQTGILPVVTGGVSLLQETKSAVWHARELAGISMSNPSHANWVNHLQPLFIAGTVFASSETGPGMKNARESQKGSIPPSAHGSRETLNTTGYAPQREDSYAEERTLLLNHLARIERETGWKTSDRTATLRALWVCSRAMPCNLCFALIGIESNYTACSIVGIRSKASIGRLLCLDANKVRRSEENPKVHSFLWPVTKAYVPVTGDSINQWQSTPERSKTPFPA
ncbi:hypothetical protein BO94DRAFT_2233 [Aspergillus sclerotioniger CBS 115572]|uniref:Transcription factor domain-containing protein n=1 Tax=Aspergillus sclerotioniger CBS 115572 TaxID=1450535 RepID=A0A317XC22_9EURO|nr:hypothetical protein BO94DRAFT_2233 [Aspergillus sclerotioniger CBS 115572]PWY96194.1 hypothetical protein BO94DRAFT_2233 [Aspergillus sclerotioniger CBS 115572]